MEVYTLYCNEDSEIKLVTSNKAEIDQFIEDHRKGREEMVEVTAWEVDRTTSAMEEVMSYIGDTIADSYCNGFFGRVYEIMLRGSRIVNIQERFEIVELKVVTPEGYELFTEFYDWEQAANYLDDWT